MTKSSFFDKFLNKLSLCGPLGAVFFFYLIGLFIFTFFRFVLMVYYWDRVSATTGFLWIFPLGLRMDTLILSYMLLFPAAILFLFPKNISSVSDVLLKGFFTLLLCFFLFMEMSTFSFMEQFDLRPDRIFFEYLKYPHEVMATVWKAYKIEVFFLLVIMGLAGKFIYHSSDWILKNYRPWGWKRRLLVLPFLVAILIFGGRSSIGHRPANISTVSFSNNHLVNELALNSSYSVLYAIYRIKHEGDSFRLYGKLSSEEVKERVKKQCFFPEESFVPSETPMQHVQKSPFERKRPLNVVIFLQESLGAEFVGALGGLPLTPNFDRLSKKGLLLTNLYATGTRTVRGIEATVSGFLPTPGRSVVKLGFAKKDFFTAGALLKEHGYTTEFIYGGMSNFDEMRSFFMGNGFDHVYDELTFGENIPKGAWGVHDEYLAQEAHKIFLAHGDEPFFAVMLSTSNHSPYDFPEGRIELYEEPKTTVKNSMKYADYAIGEFFKLAETAEYYKNTLFLIIADHNTKVRGDNLVPIHKFRIPGLIIGPDVPHGTFDKLISNVDMMPSLLHFTGLNTVHPMVGRNIMTIPEQAPGRAFMQYSSHNAYRVENDVIIMLPHKEPKQFTYQEDGHKLTPTELNPEFYKDALAHSLFPWLLYSQKQYQVLENYKKRLPEILANEASQKPLD